MAALFAAVQADALADCQAAMPAGMNAEQDRRDGYQAELLPIGSSPYQMAPLPPVPDNAVPPAMSDLYPYGGLEPTPAGAGFFHGGDEPLPAG